MSTLTAHKSSLSPSKSLNIALWAVQIALAGMFFMAGGSKLAGVEQMVQLFNTIGIGQWFRYLTGAIEVGSALLLFTPFYSGIAACLLVGTMAGAIMTHLFIVGGSIAMPATLLVGTIFVAWGRKDQILAIFKK